MSKSSVGIDSSVQNVTWATAAEAEALFTENSVVTPWALSRSTSKYGSSRVAAGTSSIVPISATARWVGSKRPQNRTARARLLLIPSSPHDKTKFTDWREHRQTSSGTDRWSLHLILELMTIPRQA